MNAGIWRASCVYDVCVFFFFDRFSFPVQYLPNSLWVLFLVCLFFLFLFYLHCSLIGLCLDPLWMWFFQGGQFWLGVKENKLKRVYVGQKKAAVNVDVGFGDLLWVHLSHVHLLNPQSLIIFLYSTELVDWLMSGVWICFWKLESFCVS